MNLCSMDADSSNVNERHDMIIACTTDRDWCSRVART